MKKHITLCFGMFHLIFASLSAQDWTWQKGETAIDRYGIYGTLGIPDPANNPGSRSSASQWTDDNGDLWLMGGDGFGESGVSGMLNDLWYFNTTTKIWTWKGGDKTVNKHGVYGTKGSPAPGNWPGGRYGASSWIDLSGNLWLFGGFGYGESGVASYLNDLWKLDPATMLWTWVSGDKTLNNTGVYGAKGIEDFSNNPGGRKLSGSWTDSSGHFWLMGGFGYPEAGTPGLLTDLWRFNPSTGKWAWESGLKTINIHGSYGVQGIPGSSNHPGSRRSPATFVDEFNDLWLFGGSGYALSGVEGLLNDTWKYDQIEKMWIWVSGDKLINQSGVYGIQDEYGESNIPGAREGAAMWVDGMGTAWMFGGLGLDEAGSSGALNDLWSFDEQSNNWIWAKGDKSVNQFGVYGSIGVLDPITKPGGRTNHQFWMTSYGELWIFGGVGYGSSAIGKLNDLIHLDVFQKTHLLIDIGWIPGPPPPGAKIAIGPNNRRVRKKRPPVVWVMNQNYTIDYLRMNYYSYTDLNGFRLEIDRGLTGRGSFIGSQTSRLVLHNIGMCYVKFAKKYPIPPFTENVNALYEFTVNASKVRMCHPRMHLPQDPEYNPLHIYGPWVVKNSAVLDLNHQHVTLHSTATETATYTQLLGGRIEEADIITVERYLPAGSRWTLLTAPIQGINVSRAWQNSYYIPGNDQKSPPGTGMLINGFQTRNAANANANGFDFWPQIANAGSSICYYLQGQAGGSWQPVPNTFNAKFDKQEAYLLFKREPRDNGIPPKPGVTKFIPTGSMKTGNIAVSVNPQMSHTLIGNPYPAVLDFEKVYTYSVNSDYIKPQIWVWDANAGQFGAFVLIRRVNGVWINVATGKPADLYLIQSGSSFFVEPINKFLPGFFVYMAEINKSDAAIVPPNRLLQPTSTEKLRIELRKVVTDGTDGKLDAVEVQFDDRYQVAVKDEEDAVRPFLFAENLSILRDDQSIVIDARPHVVRSDTIQLQLNEFGTGTYVFHVQTENLDATSLKAWLYDAHLDKKYVIPVDGRTDSVFFKLGADLGTVNTTRFSIILESAANPVKIGMLRAEQANDGVHLNWTMDKEKGIKRYQVERSVDGNEYRKIGEVKALNTGVSVTHNFIDPATLKGIVYYRINMLDSTNKSSYSNVAKIMVFSDGMSVNAYPNPVEGKAFNLSMTAMPAGKYVAEVYSINGGLLFSRNIEHGGGSSITRIDLPLTIPSGTFNLRVSSGGDVIKISKLVIR
jgi:N-acetylneuraminic acid mutarotase